MQFGCLRSWPLAAEERLTADLVPVYALPDHQCALAADHVFTGEPHRCHCGATRLVDAADA